MTLSREQVMSEVDRLIEVASWDKSEYGVQYHINNVGTSSNYGLLQSMLVGLVIDAIESNNYNPAYIIGYLIIRIWGHYPEHRAELNKIFNIDGLDHMRLEIEK